MVSYFVEGPSIGVCLIWLHARFRLYIFDRKHTEVLSSQCIISGSLCPIINDINFRCYLPNFSTAQCVISKYYLEDML